MSLHGIPQHPSPPGVQPVPEYGTEALTRSGPLWIGKYVENILSFDVKYGFFLHD